MRSRLWLLAVLAAAHVALAAHYDEPDSVGASAMGTARAPGHAPYGKPGDPDSKIFERYAEWHTRVLAEDCSKAQMLVWTASAGFGDSVNALTAAFNIALQTERLFFADWRNTNAALDSPPFLWRWDDFLASHPTRCGLPTNAAKSSPRVASIAGHIYAGHPLLKEQPFRHAGLSVNDEYQKERLLVPSAAVLALVQQTQEKLHMGKARAVIGVQIRTGAADQPRNPSLPIPEYARFLSEGDERLFLDRVKQLLNERYHEPLSADASPTAAAALPDSAVRVFVMSDSAAVTKRMHRELGGRAVSIEGAVSHTGAFGHEHTHTAAGLLKVVADWFVFRRVDVAVVTAWSLFGSSAVSTLELDYSDPRNPKYFVIDDSKCSSPGHKPCHRGN